MWLLRSIAAFLIAACLAGCISHSVATGPDGERYDRWEMNFGEDD